MNGDEQLTLDETQLIMIAAFNGLCQVIGIASRGRAISEREIDALHEGMTNPLKDPDFRNSGLLAALRDEIERVLGHAMFSNVKCSRARTTN